MLGQEKIAVVGGFSGETWLFGTSGTPRDDNLAAIAAPAL